MKQIVIAVDFDGTCVKHEYPKIGEEVKGCQDVLKELLKQGHHLILYTMRHGKELDEAIEWFKERDIKLLGVNCNPTQKEWTESPKCYAHCYIDDAALGCPLTMDVRPGLIMDEESEELQPVGRPYVDWQEIRELLVMKDILPDDNFNEE